MKTLFSYSAVLLLTFSSQADPTRPATGYVDPTKGGGSGNAVSPVSALKLQIIQNSNQRTSATINGQLLQLGEQYQGYTLTNIRATSVVLSRGEEKLILQLHNKTIKKYEE
ncbi:MAG: hypothetical protein CML20_22780 [Rheinheimera sp.]|uniref:hypothetical protein n=1 Tax=Arsukibacterium sp. UBA3155 TaxID=1946058 RepID=UPI000C967A02|nr:hypothetical protein [Arsukibacterium sp. UBA3155]MAD77556.1 hypothetical protein [Rheinheimera sp.]|tara:strand:- start:53240 stop:53572 length:333 start_codon:yes stop_codon:yes gene_type:complete